MVESNGVGSPGFDLAEAVRRTLAGDVDAFEVVVKAFHRSVRNFLASRGLGADLEDAEQEVFLRVFSALPGYEQSEPLWPWIRGIARNVSLEVFRKRAAQARARGDILSERILELAGSRERWTERAADALRECLEKIGERARRVLAGHYMGGHSSKELADREGVGASGVRNILCRARQSLRECVDRVLGTEVARP